MNCPHCNQPIPDAAVVKAAASIVGKRKRPGAIGLVRSPGRPKRKPDKAREAAIEETIFINGCSREAAERYVDGFSNRKPKEETK